MKKIAIFYFLFSLISTGICHAEIIDQLLELNFEPAHSKIIFQTEKLEISKAEIIRLDQNKYIVVATLPKKDKVKSYSFILYDQKENFYATPIKKVKFLNKTQDYKEKLNKKINFLKDRIKYFSSENDKLAEESQALENEFAERTNLKEILELKLKYQNLNKVVEFYTQAQQDLEELLKHRDFNSNSKDLATNSRILSQHLIDAAKVTAAAERLSIKKKETALGRFKQQLKAIEEMQQADLSLMAKQLLQLRKTRNSLENNMDSSSQF